MSRQTFRGPNLTFEAALAPKEAEVHWHIARLGLQISWLAADAQQANERGGGKNDGPRETRSRSSEGLQVHPDLLSGGCRECLCTTGANLSVRSKRDGGLGRGIRSPSRQQPCDA